MLKVKRFCGLVSMLVCVLLVSVCVGEEAQENLPSFVPVVFPQTQISVPEDSRKNYAANQACFSEDGMSYHDDTIDVQMHVMRRHDTPVYVIYVQIADPAQLRVEQAKPYPSKSTMRIDTIGKRVNAVVAINADWFTYHNEGIIYRNGELLRKRGDEETDGLAIDVNGDFHIVRPMTLEQYEKLEVPIMHSFSFGPALVRDGEVLEIVNRAVTYKQRMAIGQIAPLSYVLVATDGPDQPNSVGFSVPQLAQLMYDLGAHTAYNLDGGQSTSMIMNMVKVNGQAPKTMRAIGDIIYFVTAIPN